MDVNVPKFVQADIALATAIFGDLFIGVTVPPADYSVLMVGIESAAATANLQVTADLRTKMMQLYETLCVRHGVMVVGGAMSMKTSIIHTLAQGMCAVADKALFPSVKITTLNPKSVTYGQLYGTFDPNTREWMEGIASYANKYSRISVRIQKM